MRKFSKDHDWLDVDGDVATVGITEYAAAQLGDLVYVELPKVGATIEKGGTAAVVESVKTAYDILAPIAGEIVEVNQEAADDPATVTAEPLGKGWLYKIKLASAADADSLLDETAYKASLD